MNIFEGITKALNKPFKQFGFDNNIKTYLENINAPTDTDEPYLASFMLTAPTEQADLSVNEFRQGVYQIDINYASHLGSASINKMADLLNERFKTGSNHVFNDICLQVQSVDLNKLTVSDGWAMRSLSINWQTYTPRI
jgi:hypothetical protein